MVHRVARRDGVDIDLCLAEGVADAGEGARAIVQEEGELSGDVHSDLAFVRPGEFAFASARRRWKNGREFSAADATGARAWGQSILPLLRRGGEGRGEGKTLVPVDQFHAQAFDACPRPLSKGRGNAQLK